MQRKRFLPLVACLAVLIGAEASRAQPGSDGGVIGKQGKSATGSGPSDQGAKPAPENSRRNTTKPHAASPCRGFAGSWTWSTGGVAVVNANGSLSKGALTGQWTCSGSSVTIVWSHGYIDKLNLSRDGKSLDGRNNAGFRVKGTRAGS